MKILCVIDSLGSGGAQRQLLNLAIGFKGRNNDVSFLVYHEESFFKSLLDEKNIPVYQIIESNYLRRLWKIRRFIRRGGYDAVLSFLEASNFICEIAGLPLRKWKLVVGERSANPNILKSFKLCGYRWFHLLADYVVANSNANMKMVKKINPFLPDRKCRVIYNSIDLNEWNLNHGYIQPRGGKFRMVIIASHQYLKNLLFLVEAINLLSQEKKEQLLVEWYGDVQDGSKEEGLRKIEQYHLESVFQFFPPTHNIKEIMMRSDAVGLFSVYEGFPNVICEGMAMSKPIICSNISDIPMIFSNTGNFLCEPLDPASIHQSISKLLDTSKSILVEIGSKNRRIANEKFNPESNLDQYLELLNK